MTQRKDTMNLDAYETAFFKRQLEFVKAQTYDVVYKDLKAFQIIPVSGDAPSGATEITWRSYARYGMAKVIADYAHDFPRVDIMGEEHTIQIKDLGDSYGYSLKEIRRAQIVGLDLEPRRAAAARRAIEEKMNSIAFDGDTDNNIQGLFDYPGITAYTVPTTGTGNTRTWSTKSADNILVDLNGIVTAIMTATNGKERPNLIIVPLEQYNLIANTPRASNSDTTILQFFKNNNPDIAVEWVVELDGAGAAGVDRFMAYTRDAYHLTLEIPVMFEQLEEEKTAMEYRIPCHAEIAGVIVYYPTAVAYGDGI